ncbi:MAG: hypothetical protein IJ088_15355 [Clostridia bacterium]|nr:hypothetical protein [Clostridia bacterium]
MKRKRNYTNETVIPVQNTDRKLPVPQENILLFGLFLFMAVVFIVILILSGNQSRVSPDISEEGIRIVPSIEYELREPFKEFVVSFTSGLIKYVSSSVISNDRTDTPGDCIGIVRYKIETSFTEEEILDIVQAQTASIRSDIYKKFDKITALEITWEILDLQTGKTKIVKDTDSRTGEGTLTIEVEK